MKLKYYLRGMGIGIIVTTIILAISFSQREVEISDAEIISRAVELGMVMQEEDSEPTEMMETESQLLDSEAQLNEMLDELQNGVDVPATEEPITEEPITEEPVAQEGTFHLVIQRGEVCRTVCENLAANGVIDDAEAFRTYLFEIGYASNMSIGEYEIPYGLTDEEVADALGIGRKALWKRRKNPSLFPFGDILKLSAILARV